MAGFNSRFTGNQLESILKFFLDDNYFLEKILEKGIITPFGEENDGQITLFVDTDSTDDEKILLVM